jgi:hypothetical protein
MPGDALRDGANRNRHLARIRRTERATRRTGGGKALSQSGSNWGCLSLSIPTQVEHRPSDQSRYAITHKEPTCPLSRRKVSHSRNAPARSAYSGGCRAYASAHACVNSLTAMTFLVEGAQLPKNPEPLRIFQDSLPALGTRPAIPPIANVIRSQLVDSEPSLGASRGLERDRS